MAIRDVDIRDVVMNVFFKTSLRLTNTLRGAWRLQLFNGLVPRSWTCSDEEWELRV